MPSPPAVTPDLDTRDVLSPGEGQFGDVFLGTYSPPGGAAPMPVAVKTCKIDHDGSMANKFLEEARECHQDGEVLLRCVVM